jgi:hypothetical protein
MPSPTKFDHPTHGPSILVPSLVAIKWSRPLSADAIGTALANHSLSRATEAPGFTGQPAGAARDPRPVRINQSATLTWASSDRRLTETARARLASDDMVDWVSPAYRSASGESGPEATFAIDPTVVFLTPAAAQSVGDVSAIDPAAAVDHAQSGRLKGLVALDLPNQNAVEVAVRLAQVLGGQSAAGAVRLSNIPYLSPTTGCGCGGDIREAPTTRKDCSPATADISPDDTFYPDQWGLQRINAPRAWPVTEGDPNVVIAVLDEGVELAHPDLSMWPLSYSTVTHTNDGGPIGDHGTACAGIIGGRIGNALGVAGLAGGCRVMAIATNFADTEVAEGLYFAADNGARVVSMSFGRYASWGGWDFTIIEAALQYCHDHGVVLVAAAGNEDQNICRFPGSDPRTITVGGSNRDDVRKQVGDTSIEQWWGACFGPDLDVVAPCLEIPTTDRLGAAGYTATDYDLRFNGTSAATPHVAALAGLLFSVSPGIGSADVRRIISETTDKINAGAYPYLPTAGKPYGSWNTDVGYGRINAERAVLVACAWRREHCDCGPCGVDPCLPDECCVSPCDPPWRPDEQCLVWYEDRFLRLPLGKGHDPAVGASGLREYIEIDVTYEHRMCVLGKQHGALLFTQTLLPGEKTTLYHSDRYRRIASQQDQYSVQTTFMQFLSAVHQARTTMSLDAMSELLVSAEGSASASVGGGLAGLLGLPGGSTTTQAFVSSQNALHVAAVSDQFQQSVVQATQLTHSERSVIVSNYEDEDALNVTARELHNDNECRAVTYFVRKVVELYAVSTVVSRVSYRIVGPGVAPDWHGADDLGWVPAGLRAQIQAALASLPKVGETVERARPISLPTDGTVYDPELAHCCSCEPERAAAIELRLERDKADALKACLEAQMVEVELERRRLLLRKGALEPFEPPLTVTPFGEG